MALKCLTIALHSIVLLLLYCCCTSSFSVILQLFQGRSALARYHCELFYCVAVTFYG